MPGGATLVVRLCSEPLVVLADAVHLQQVIVNLCSNAFQSLHGAPGRVEVGLERIEFEAQSAARPSNLPPGGYAHLWISDTGSGMDETTLRHIFEPFFTTRSVGQGVGLGLSAVHGIVASHGGAISVDSTPGLGSSFHVYLPALATADTFCAATARDGAAPQGDVQHVLYADDDETVMILMNALLQRAGYRVTCHCDPLAAVSAVRARPDAFDLIITDFNMPALTGLGLAADVASIRADLPVVIHTGHISDAVRHEAARIGVRSVVHKGGSFDELGTVVHRILGAGRTTH